LIAPSQSNPIYRVLAGRNCRSFGCGQTFMTISSASSQRASIAHSGSLTLCFGDGNEP